MLSIASIDLGSYGKPPPGCSTALVSFAVSLGGHNKRTRPATTGDDLIDRCPRPNFDLFVKGRINSRRHVVILYHRPTNRLLRIVQEALRHQLLPLQLELGFGHEVVGRAENCQVRPPSLAGIWVAHNDNTTARCGGYHEAR